MKTQVPIRKFAALTVLFAVISVPIISFAEESRGKSNCIRVYGQLLTAQLFNNSKSETEASCNISLNIDRFFGNKKATTSITSNPSLTIDSPTIAEVPKVLKRKLAPIYVRPGIAAANLNWTTKKPSSSTVFYSTSTPVDISAETTFSQKTKSNETSHTLIIDELEANTKYYVVITAEDSNGELLYSPEFYFTTGLTEEMREQNTQKDDETFIEVLLTLFTTREIAAASK